MQRLCEPTAERKYVLDTNLFIRAFREEAANAQLQRFHQLFAPFEYLNAVVAQELRAGARCERSSAVGTPGAGRIRSAWPRGDSLHPGVARLGGPPG